MTLSANLTASKRRTAAGLSAAVHRNRTFSRAWALERLFTVAFKGLVYPQIWEDPVVDMEALAIKPDDRVVAIASGGCNVMSYLVADPARITAVDLNGAHTALLRLKIGAARRLPDYDTFRRFFGEANQRENVAAYHRHIKPHLDGASRAYWEGRTLTGRRRIELFARNFYRYGLLGWFIGAGHFVARAHGKDPRRMLQARSLEEQSALFDSLLAPLFQSRTVRFLVNQPATLFGLGIPPAQYEALAGDHEGGMAAVLHERLRRLACDHELSENYFARQAFGRGYGDGATPPYLERGAFEAVRARADRVETRHMSMGDFLDSCADASLDAYVLLDAQDWMDNAALTALWRKITRTARPAARVIFRTAADERLLPGRIPDEILARWDYDETRCRELSRRDRSSIYGAFHLYTLKDAA
ncbi:MAG TPA: BtaA family protein [Methylocystis sp.]|nr:BtaA family protein [Methylocystis sp.]